MKALIGCFLIAITYCSLYSCVEQSFKDKCKSLLYPCLNEPTCSYQMNINARHINLDPKSTTFPKLFLSHPKALLLYECLRLNCDLPQLDSQYPRTLPLEHCMFQVHDICGGKELESIYQDYKNNIETEFTTCYRKHCGR